MLLRNLKIIDYNGIADIYIKDGKINTVGNFNNNPAEGHVIYFDDVIAFPGLINSHDHLDFNLFPSLGNRIYRNYVEWGKDIHRQNKDVIGNVLKVPKQLRIQWGIYKNLLNGITTIINHGPELKIEGDLI